MKIKLDTFVFVPLSPKGTFNRQYERMTGEVEVSEEIAKELKSMGHKFDLGKLQHDEIVERPDDSNEKSGLFKKKKKKKKKAKKISQD